MRRSTSAECGSAAKMRATTVNTSISRLYNGPTNRMYRILPYTQEFNYIQTALSMFSRYSIGDVVLRNRKWKIQNDAL